MNKLEPRPGGRAGSEAAMQKGGKRTTAWGSTSLGSRDQEGTKSRPDPGGTEKGFRHLGSTRTTPTRPQSADKPWPDPVDIANANEAAKVAFAEHVEPKGDAAEHSVATPPWHRDGASVLEGRRRLGGYLRHIGRIPD